MLTDTHIPWVGKELPRVVMDTLQDTDLILHGGDIYSHAVLDQLEEIAPVLAALGDDDYPTLDSRVKEKHVVVVDSFVIWLLHEGPPINGSSYWLPRWLKHRTAVEEPYLPPDIIISGHEHRTILDHIDGILQINSGSATYLDYKEGLGSVGLLEITSGTARVELINLLNSNKISCEIRR